MAVTTVGAIVPVVTVGLPSKPELEIFVCKIVFPPTNVPFDVGVESAVFATAALIDVAV